MDYILDKYVSPRVFYDAGFSSSRLAARGRWAGKTFSEGVSLEEGSVSMDVLVNQSKEKDCEPHVFIEGGGMQGGKHLDPDWRDGRLCGAPAISCLTGKCREMVCAG